MDIYVQNFVRKYISEGFAVIPVEFQSKQPKIPDWPKLVINEADVGKYFGQAASSRLDCGLPLFSLSLLPNLTESPCAQHAH
jgi:hypothetical protein